MPTLSTTISSEAVKVRASVQLEMWAFGVVLYQLCTTDGETLWHANQADNIEEEEMQEPEVIERGKRDDEEAEEAA